MYVCTREKKISGCMHADNFHKKWIWLFNSLLLTYVGPVDWFSTYISGHVQGLRIIVDSYFIFKYVFILYFHTRSTYS